MADLPAPLPRRYYLSWVDGEHNHDIGVKLAKSLAALNQQRLTVILANKNHLQPIFKGVDIVTTRSGGPLENRFVAAIYPNARTMSRFYGDDMRFMIVDWARNPMRGWGAVHGAYDLRTGQYLEDDRPQEVRVIHERIAHSGYNGFTSPPGSYTIKKDLTELHKQGWLDERGKDYLVASLFEEQSDSSLADLRKLADKVNARPPHTWE